MPQKHELKYIEELSTAVFKVDIPQSDMAMLLKVCAEYFTCSDSDHTDFKNKVVSLCGLRAGVKIEGRVGIDVVMLSDDRMSKIICLDVRRADEGHVDMYLCENEAPAVQLIDPSIVRTFELFHAMLIEDNDKTLSYYKTLKIRAAGAEPDAVSEVMGPNGVVLTLCDFGPKRICSNCSGNTTTKHAVHGFNKYSDGNKVELCVPCCTTLGAVELSVRWNHVYTAIYSSVFDLNPPAGVSKSGYQLSVWNQIVMCEGCFKRAIPERMHQCQNRNCSSVYKSFCLCTTCIGSVKQKHTFAHMFAPFVSESEKEFSKIIC